MKTIELPKGTIFVSEVKCDGVDMKYQFNQSTQTLIVMSRYDGELDIKFTIE